MGLKEVNTSVITINGDNIFSENIIKQLKKIEKNIVLTVSCKSEYDEDDMKVIINKEKKLLYCIGKQLSPNEANAESIGIVKWSIEGLKQFKKILETLFLEDHKNINKFYLFAIQELANIGYAVNTLEIDKDEWREFDFPEDLSSAIYELQKGILRGKVFEYDCYDTYSTPSFGKSEQINYYGILDR